MSGCIMLALFFILNRLKRDCFNLNKAVKKASLRSSCYMCCDALQVRFFNLFALNRDYCEVFNI